MTTSHTPESSAVLKTTLPGVQEFYSEYYAKKGIDRNDLLQNPGALFQVLAQDAAMIRALRATGLTAPTLPPSRSVMTAST